MSIPGSANPLLLASAAPTSYQVQRSLRFNSADSAYLSRTPASAGNRKTWTWSGWVKRSGLGTYQRVFNARNPGVAADYIRFNNDDTLELYFGATLITAQVFRDVSSWYHLTVAVDTTQATSSNRVKLYVNGTQVTTFATTNYPSQNADTLFNATLIHNIGTGDGTTEYFSGYLADIHFIDGQALTPSSFAETNATTGQWVPKAYSGSYGTNGFRLDFSDNSAATATTLGKDRAGSNNWTPNNLSVTAGAGNDSLVDTPTSYGTDTGAGGEVRGNYCTWNPLTGQTFAAGYQNGNLDFSTNSIAADGLHVFGTFQLPASGKWYWETVFSTSTGFPGINSNASIGNNTQLSTMKVYTSGGLIGGVGGNATWTTNDVIGMAYDADAGTLQFYKNGSLQPTSIASVGFSTGPWWPQVRQDRNAASSTNFGQRPFAYTAPSGFKALCDTNLPAPVVAKPSDYFQAVAYVGNGTSKTISGLSFSPDLVWIKDRTTAYHHWLTDSVRGVGKQLSSSQTIAETSYTTLLTSFNSDGFTLGTDSAVNNNNDANIAWCFDAGSNTVSNTAGSITSSVRANASAGFSIVSYNLQATGSKTVGHGLGVAPSLIIAIPRSVAHNTFVYHSSVGATAFLYLNTTGASSTNSTAWDNTSPSSSVFTLGSGWTSGTYGTEQIAYCFAPVAGYSAFGSYTGNGSADGPFVFCNFRPRWVLVKTSTGSTGWVILDAARNTSNIANLQLFPHDPTAELSSPAYFACDFLSNGFKLRTADVASNGSSATYIYAAFAENPFQFARAR